MSVKVMGWVWDSSRATGNARFVLLAIADCANERGEQAYPSMAELVRKTSLAERTVQMAIRSLVRLGELEVDRNGGPKGTNRYRVVMRTPADPAPPQILHPPQDLHPAESAGSPNPQVSGETPAGSAPPQDLHPPQNLHPTPAESAPGTVLEPSVKDSSSKSPPKGVRGKRIPADFTPTDEMRTYAAAFASECLGRPPGDRFQAWLDRKTTDFVDYWTEQSGSRGVKTDWVRAWQRWMRREIERFAEHPRSLAPPPPSTVRHIDDLTPAQRRARNPFATQGAPT